jgi:hypothetical protein
MGACFAEVLYVYAFRRNEAQSATTRNQEQRDLDVIQP